MKPLCELFLLAACLGTDPLPAPDRPAVIQMVASPVKQSDPPPPGLPVMLDTGKFVWLELKTTKNGVMVPYEGKVKFDFSKSGFVKLYPSPPKGSVAADSYPGIKQGETEPDWHKKPSAIAVPCLGVKGGDVTISAWGIVDEEPAKIAELTIRVRGPPDVDPNIDPDVTPKPIGTNPFSNQFGLHVLMIFDRDTMTESQKAITHGGKVRSYLDAKCGVGPDGKTKTYRIWPSNVVTGDEEKVWIDAFKKERKGNWIMIGNGPNGTSEPLPADPDAALALLKKYGG